MQGGYETDHGTLSLPHDNNLSRNVDKTKEMVVDIRRNRVDQSTLHINGTILERVKSFKFLGVHMMET